MDQDKKKTAPQERGAAKPRFQTDEERQRHSDVIAKRRFLSLIEKNALESGIPLSLLKVILQGSNDWFIIRKLLAYLWQNGQREVPMYSVKVKAGVFKP